MRFKNWNIVMDVDTFDKRMVVKKKWKGETMNRRDKMKILDVGCGEEPL